MLALVLVFAFFCTPRAGKGLLGLLEGLTPEVSLDGSELSRPPVVLVLGGGAVAEGGGYEPSLSSQRRLRQGLRYLEGSDGMLMLSGIESPLLEQWLRAQGFQGDILMERRSQNTAQNLTASGELLARTFPEWEERPQIWIVSDRYHLFRVMLWARRCLQGFRALAAPAPSLLGMGCPVTGDCFPSLKGLERTSTAWREILALVKDWLCLRFSCLN